jgi:hypothetical protein
VAAVEHPESNAWRLFPQAVFLLEGLNDSGARLIAVAFAHPMSRSSENSADPANDRPRNTGQQSGPMM